MGYYSEVSIGMFKDDFERLIKNTKFCNDDENDKKDAYLCLTEYCDHYYSDKYRAWNYKATPPRPVGPTYEIIVLHWYDIKLYGTGMKYILEYLQRKGKYTSALTWVGENIDDVGYEEYIQDEPDIYWQEYMQPVSNISIETRGANSPNYKDFIKKLEGR